MKITGRSHTDHGLSEAHLEYIKTRFIDRTGFFIETVELPDSLPEVPSAIYGPVVGDEPISEGEVFYVRRGERPNLSRMIDKPTRPTRKLTVIAGPTEEEPCVLYTAFGGPLAPKEPGDPSLKEGEEMRKATAFWSQHALASQS